MACYLYSESENQPAIPACNCHYAGQSCSFPILSSLPPGRPGCLKVINCAVLMLHYNTIVQCRSGYRRLIRLLNCAALMLICVYIVQCRSGYVVSLTTPTKAEPLYKVHTHATNFMIEIVLILIEVILEYFCLFLFTHNYIFLLYIECLYQRFTVNKNNNYDDNIDINSLSSSSDLEVHCKQEQDQHQQYQFPFFVFFIRGYCKQEQEQQQQQHQFFVFFIGQ